jgi:hypothetical protein
MNIQIEALQVSFENFTLKKQDTIEAWFQVQALFFLQWIFKQRERERTWVQARGQNPKWVTKGQKNKGMGIAIFSQLGNWVNLGTSKSPQKIATTSKRECISIPPHGPYPSLFRHIMVCHVSRKKLLIPPQQQQQRAGALTGLLI